MAGSSLSVRLSARYERRVSDYARSLLAQNGVRPKASCRMFDYIKVLWRNIYLERYLVPLYRHLQEPAARAVAFSIWNYSGT